MKIRQKISVHAYKYNGWLYRSYEFPQVLDINKEYICLKLNKTRVITQNMEKRNFHSQISKDSLWFFFYDEWFNLIVTKTPKGDIVYYFNIASPFIFEEGAIKYYDFDLDIQMFDISQQNIKQLDYNEFLIHQKIFDYPKNLIEKIITTEKQLMSDLKLQLFQNKINLELVDKYLSEIKNKDE